MVLQERFTVITARKLVFASGHYSLQIAEVFLQEHRGNL
jgi:hypothetical protein